LGRSMLISLPEYVISISTAPAYFPLTTSTGCSPSSLVRLAAENSSNDDAFSHRAPNLRLSKARVGARCRCRNGISQLGSRTDFLQAPALDSLVLVNVLIGGINNHLAGWRMPTKSCVFEDIRRAFARTESFDVNVSRRSRVSASARWLVSLGAPPARMNPSEPARTPDSGGLFGCILFADPYRRRTYRRGSCTKKMTRFIDGLKRCYGFEYRVCGARG
jgi:hypothetical protein